MATLEQLDAEIVKAWEKLGAPDQVTRDAARARIDRLLDLRLISRVPPSGRITTPRAAS